MFGANIYNIYYIYKAWALFDAKYKRFCVKTLPLLSGNTAAFRVKHCRISGKT